MHSARGFLGNFWYNENIGMYRSVKKYISFAVIVGVIIVLQAQAVHGADGDDVRGYIRTQIPGYNGYVSETDKKLFGGDTAAAFRYLESKKTANIATSVSGDIVFKSKKLFGFNWRGRIYSSRSHYTLPCRGYYKYDGGGG